jgi:ribosome-associated protein
MPQVKIKNETKVDLVASIVEGMQDKKAQDISVLNLNKIGSAVASYFVLCTGQSSTQIEAIAEGIMEATYKKSGQRPLRKEGFSNREWVLLDYVDVVVHIFHSEKRDLYGLDKLWGDAEITHF